MSDEPDESERTVFRPGKGGAAASPPPAAGGYTAPAPQVFTGARQQGAAPDRAAPSAPQAPSSGTPGAQIDFATLEPELYGPEPLVAAAGRLIHLGGQIRSMPIGPDINALRRLVVKELEAFKERARRLGLEPRSVQLAHYMLCAFIDDAVMTSPWGRDSQWSRQSLLAAYHNDTYGGDRMFQFADRMVQDPQREPRLLELLYLCLSLGFEGRAGLDPRGESMLAQNRARLAAVIQRERQAQPADLSPQWRGKTVASGAYAPRIPLWAIAAAIGALALLIFAALLFRLSSSADTALAGLDRAVGNSVVVPPPPPPQSQTPTFQRMGEILRPDIEAGRLELLREGSEIVIRLNNQGLFASAEAAPSGQWAGTLARLAEAANLTSGPIAINGHTDDQAIRSLAFPSNQALSEARAEAVAAAIGREGLGDGSRVSTQGFAATRPISSNDSEDGRRRNRRVELRVANDIAWR